ncbi:hypothetical protein GCM10011571_35150 [Marinithermofilum abyssi]|uniref:Uncharacterized protein n=2 Tax=Marinithermofilum abyssi TaxID=1571185 RepID=A0A8J2VM86_9BACL|nr:hypothetical protein GCM10011571_35150 [Marinithermofilum abyssi]
MIESQINYILDALRTMKRADTGSIEVRREPFEAYNDYIQSRMGRTVWNAGGCSSWYLDAHGRNTTLWTDFTWKFRLRTRRFDPENYIMTPHRRSASPVRPVSSVGGVS